LALTREVCTIVMAPKNIYQEKTRVKIADEISEMLDVDRDELYAKTQKSNSQYEVVKEKVDRAVGDEFIAWVDENGLEGVFRVVVDYKREYPQNSFLSAVIGFVGSDGKGLVGLESQYDSVLAGTPGRMVIAQNTSGDQLPTSLDYEYTVDAEDGYSLVLTVDEYIQQVTEKHLVDTLQEFEAANRGCAIVMDPQTGAILAMATKGDYDLNNPFEISDPATKELIETLEGDEKTAARKAALEKQWKNKALEFYEPGSVFKTFTASIGLEEGLVTEMTAFTCGSAIQIADKLIRCWIYPRSHGTLPFRDAFANSCNSTFVQLAGEIGAQLFSKYYVGFGFTNKTGVDLYGEPSVSSSLYYDPETMKPVDVATSSIGQTFKVTPLQMATALCAVANGGYLMQPYIVQKIVDSDGNVIQNTEPTVKRQVISADTSKRMCAMLENAVSGGAIKNAYITGYRVGGKTGTAQKTETRPEDEKDEDKIKVIASFGGIAPAENPEVVVLVMADEPSVRSGGTVAAPLAKKILKDILPHLGVEPNYTEEEIAGLDRSVPQVMNKKVSVAATTLGSAGLTYKTIGNGNTVVRQIPESGSTIPKNGTVWLYTENVEPEMTTVPDFMGKTVSQVNQLAAKAGINVVLSGISTGGGTAVASKQSATLDQKVPKGTVVTVEFTYTGYDF
ncbi:MAG: PASTA domain-containing protein, partial [Clostridia bacterium]|nr:PASTA domain-containing protein [Clostridia bacterium]